MACFAFVRCSRHKLRAWLEVFSAGLRCIEPHRQFTWSGSFGYHGFFGVVLLRSCNRDFVIFDSQPPGPPLINLKGSVTLTGPKRSIPVEDEVVLFPWFFTLYACYMYDGRESMWKAGEDVLDQFICKNFTVLGLHNLEVNFAVYSDAVEAHLDVYLVDFENGEEDVTIQVHGTLSASNTLLSDRKAKSLLFNKSSDEFVNLKLGKSIPFPLSRKMIVIPHKSNLLVHVCMEVGTKLGDTSVIDGMVEFNPSSNSDEKFIGSPNNGKLMVKDAWMECQDFVE